MSAQKWRVSNTLKGSRMRAAGAVVLLSPLLFSVPVSAINIDATNDVDIVQVEFADNGTPTIQTASGGTPLQSGNTPAEITQITIADGSQTLVLDEYNVGNVDVQNINFPANLTGVGTYENGVFTDSTDPGFETALERVLSSRDFRDYVAYDFLSVPASQFNPDFDVMFDAPLTNDDYVVVAERNGNTFFDIEALDINGNPIPGAEIIGFDAPYAWNTNYAPAELPSQPHWLTVADVDNFNVNTNITPIYGFRVNNDGQADVKFWGASADPFAPHGSLAGSVVVDDGTPIAGVTVTLTGTDALGNQISLTTTTNANGDYLFEGLLEGIYTLTETQPSAYDDSNDVVGSASGTLANDEISAITLGPGVDAVDYDFIETVSPQPELEAELELGAVEGQVFFDLLVDGVLDGTDSDVAGVTVNLTDGNGVTVATTTTAADGTYSFGNLPAGDYLVEIVPPVDSTFTVNGGDSLFSTAVPTVPVTVVAGQTVTNIDAGIVDVPVPALASTPAEPAPAPTLALTGVESGLLTLIGLALMVLGAVQVRMAGAGFGLVERRK